MKKNSNVIIHPRYLDNKRKTNEEVVNGEEKKKNKIKPFAYVLLLVVMIFVLSAFGRFAWSSYQLSQEITAYLIKVEHAKIHNAQLLQELEQFQNPIFIERLARERLGLVRAGERVIVPTVPGDVMSLSTSTEDDI